MVTLPYLRFAFSPVAEGVIAGAALPVLGHHEAALIYVADPARRYHYTVEAAREDWTHHWAEGVLYLCGLLEPEGTTQNEGKCGCKEAVHDCCNSFGERCLLRAARRYYWPPLLNIPGLFPKWNITQ